MCKVIIPEGLRCVTQDEQDALLEKQWRARVELRAKLDRTFEQFLEDQFIGDK